MERVPNKHNLSDTVVILELLNQEIELIKAIRSKWRFGEITIQVREGVPYRIMRVQEFIDLNNPEK